MDPVKQREHIIRQIRFKCDSCKMNLSELARLLHFDYMRLWSVINGLRVMYPEELTNLSYVLEVNQFYFIPDELRGNLEKVRMALAQKYW